MVEAKHPLRRFFGAGLAVKGIRAALDGADLVLRDHEDRDAIMNVIRCGRDEPLAPPSVYPDDDRYDRWLDNARASWTQGRGMKPEDAEIVCSLALIKESIEA